MNFKRVEPAQAVEWIRGAVHLMLSNPAPFLLMGLTMSVIALVPLLGAFILLIISPVLYGGIALAARTQDRGGQADFNQLLDGFRLPGKAGPLIALCLPSVAFVFVAVLAAAMVMLSFGATALFAEGSPPPDPSQIDLGTLFGTGGLVMLALVLIPLSLLTAALLFFALPRVMFDGVEPLPALRESAQAAFANLGAFLLTVLTLFFARAAIALLLGSIQPFLALLVANTVFPPLIACVLYLAWKDVFGTSEAAIEPGAQPPSPTQVIEV